MTTHARYDGALPLAEFLESFLDAGFQLEHIEEPGTRDYPTALALRWRRP
jgi:hypothetical protein